MVYAHAAEGARGRYLFLGEAPRSESRQVEVRASDPELAGVFRSALAELLAARREGAFVPRLLDPTGRKSADALPVVRGARRLRPRRLGHAREAVALVGGAGPGGRRRRDARCAPRRGAPRPLAAGASEVSAALIDADRRRAGGGAAPLRRLPGARGRRGHRQDDGARRRVVAWCLGPGWARASQARGETGEAERRERSRAACSRGVVAITFTEAAAAEMEQRIGERASRDRARRAAHRARSPRALPAAAARAARARSAPRGARPARRPVDPRLLPAPAGRPSRSRRRLHPRFEVDGDGAGQRAACARCSASALPAAFAPVAGERPRALCLRGRERRRARARASATSSKQGVPPRLFDADPCRPQRVADRSSRSSRSRCAALARRRRAAGSRRLRAPRPCGARGARATPCAAADAAASDCGRPRDARSARRREPGATTGSIGSRDWREGDFTKSEAERLGAAAVGLAAAARGAAPLLRHVASARPARSSSAARRRRRRAAPRGRRRGCAREGLVPFATLLGAARRCSSSDPRSPRPSAARSTSSSSTSSRTPIRVQCEHRPRASRSTGPRASARASSSSGDPKQSIYGWRSADLAAYDGFLARGARRRAAPLRLVDESALAGGDPRRGRARRSRRSMQRASAACSRASSRCSPIREQRRRVRPALARSSAGLPASASDPGSAARDDARGRRPRAGSRRRRSRRTLRALHGERAASPGAGCAVLLRASERSRRATCEALRGARHPVRRRERPQLLPAARGASTPRRWCARSSTRTTTLALVALLRSAVGRRARRRVDAALRARELPRLARRAPRRRDPAALAEVAPRAVRVAAARAARGHSRARALAGWEESLRRCAHDLARAARGLRGGDPATASSSACAA